MDLVIVALLVIGGIAVLGVGVVVTIFLLFLFGDELERGADYLEKLADRIRGRERS